MITEFTGPRSTVAPPPRRGWLLEGLLLLAVGLLCALLVAVVHVASMAALPPPRAAQCAPVRGGAGCWQYEGAGVWRHDTAPLYGAVQSEWIGRKP